MLHVQPHLPLPASLLDQTPRWQTVRDITKPRKSCIVPFCIQPTAIFERKTFRRLCILKSTVSNQLGVQPAIDAKIELFQKNPIHPRIQTWAGFTGIDRDGGGSCK